MRALGRKGGEATKAKHGHDGYYTQIARMGGLAARGKPRKRKSKPMEPESVLYPAARKKPLHEILGDIE